MKTYLARYWAVYGISLVAPALAACGDSAAMPTESDTDTQGTTEETPTTSSTTSDDTTQSVPTTSTDTTTTTTDTTGDTTTTTDETTGTTDGTTGPVSATSTGDTDTGDLCMTILCGDPAVCCLDTEECLDGACQPICESGVRCGADQEECCAAGDVCVGDSCTTPGALCNDSYDCPPGNYCEAVVGKCLPQPDPLLCEVVPSFDNISVQLEWSWTANEVLVIPLTADVQGDETPELVINTNKVDNLTYGRGEIVLLNGATGTEIWRIPENPAMQQYGSWGAATPALGDFNGDGKPDIFYSGRQDGQKFAMVHAVDGNGQHLWTGHNPDGSPVKIRWDNGAAAVANLDNDPEAEIAVGGVLFDNDGLMVWNQGGNGGIIGTPTDNLNPPKLLYTGGLPTFADLTGDGKPELITGREAWTINWIPGDPPTASLTLLWKNMDGKGNDGWPSVGDLDQNGTPEVILVAWPDIKVLDGKTGKLWCGVDPTGAMCEADDALRTQPLTIPGNGLGGPPTIADFDGDGRPELAIAAASAYTVFDINRAGEEIVKPGNDVAPMPGALFRRWSQATQDQSSNATGSSVFDFQGDGAAEVTYNDECYARVYSGSDGKELLKIENSSSTIHEYPLVVDADADGNSEILMVANIVGSCAAQGYAPRKGVFLYGDAGDGWVPTRRVWTQHTYHVTNAVSTGNVPPLEDNNWSVPGLNNYRQNVQGEGVFNSPDLTVQLAIGLGNCPDGLELIATVRNEGAAGVPAGIAVDFYAGVDATGTLLGSDVTAKALLPGGSTKLTLIVPAPADGQTQDYFVEVDKASEGDGAVLECNEDNNGGQTTMAACPKPG